MFLITTTLSLYIFLFVRAFFPPTSHEFRAMEDDYDEYVRSPPAFEETDETIVIVEPNVTESAVPPPGFSIFLAIFSRFK